MIVITGLLSVEEAINISSPKGGVIIPKLIFIVTINPKCTGSMPNITATGNKGGTKIKSVEFGSMNMPAIKKLTLTTNKNTIGPALIAFKNVVMASGT